MRSPKRQKHHSGTKRHASKVPVDQNGAAPGRRSPKSSGRARGRRRERHAPLPVLTLRPGIAGQPMGGPRGNYPPPFNRADVSFGFTQRYTNGQPDRFSPDLRQLQRGGGSRLLIESGSAVTRLMDLHDDDVTDSRRPGDRAHVRAHSMLVGLKDLNLNIPASDVYLDPDGAIRLLWTQDYRNVELVFPSIEDEAPYLYHSDENNYGVEERPSPEGALKWILWVLDNLLPGHTCAA